jgi:hypothetical protein
MNMQQGTHPDKPWPVSSIEDSIRLCMNRATCPKCGKHGGHKVVGHAQLFKRTGSAIVECDAECVQCRKCAVLFPAYTTGAKKATLGKAYADMLTLCEQDSAASHSATGNWKLSMALEVSPELWLPLQYLADDAEPADDDEEVDEALDGTDAFSTSPIPGGPVILYCDQDTQDELGNVGCGHYQALVLGPDIATILRQMPSESSLLEILKSKGYCGLCGKRRNCVIVAIEQHVPKRLLNQISVLYQCPMVKIPRGTSQKHIDQLPPAMIQKAAREVVVITQYAGPWIVRTLRRIFG